MSLQERGEGIVVGIATVVLVAVLVVINHVHDLVGLVEGGNLAIELFHG